MNKDKLNNYVQHYHQNGDKYFGESNQNGMHGTGQYVWSNGDVIQCNWYNNEINNKVIFSFNSGKKYEGEWKNGHPLGKGIIIDNDYPMGSSKDIDYYEQKIFDQSKKIIKLPNEIIISSKETQLNNLWKSFAKIFEKIFDYKIGKFPIIIIFSPLLILVAIGMPIFVIVWWGPLFLLKGIFEVFFRDQVALPKFIFWGWTIFITYIFWGNILKNIMSMF